MKQIYTLLIALMLPAFIYAQAPDAFNYQAVVRDQAGQVVANKEVNFQISLLQGSPTGTTIYAEIHFAATNNFGLVTLEIGHGTSISGDFASIDWSKSNYFIEVAVDLDGGTNFMVMGASRLLSVPYALYAQYAGNAFSGDYEDLVNRPVNLSSFINDAGYLTIADLQRITDGNEDGLIMSGVPAQTWSLFGNSGTDPAIDKLGTTDSVDLVFVTNDEERLRITADGDINLQNSLEIGEDLTVQRNVYLNVTSGQTQNFGPFTVENGSDTYLTGDLDVDGGTDLNGTLDVDGATDLNSSLNVDGATDLNSTLDVDGAAALHSSLGVDGAADLNSSLNVDGATVLNSTLNANGQVTISTSVAGGDGNYAAYPLRVEGSDQGIAVKVNGTRNNNKNFLTFWDANGRQGRVEGQTSAELHSSFDYIWFQTQEALQTAFQIAMVAVDLLGVDDFDAAVVEGIEMVNIIANWAVMAVDMELNVGVAYESGSGDYAEWLLKSNQAELFSYGDIVGVSGGKISKAMASPDHYLVVSMSPIVLGNMPPQGLESRYEKVAFMGQVPVKVRGQVNIGDYIVPSGLNDGFGRAIHPDAMTLELYDQIVGIAWSASQGNAAFSYVNTAVGINTNDLTAEIGRQKSEIESLKGNINSILNYLKSKDPGFDATLYEIEEQISPPSKTAEQEGELLSRSETIERLINILEENPEILQQILADARTSLDKRGVNYNQYEQTRRLVNDEAYFIEVLRASAE